MDDRLKKQIEDAMSQGLSLSEFVRMNNLNYFTIRNLCKKNGIVLPGLKNNGKSKSSKEWYERRKKIDKSGELNIVQRYQNGANREELAQEFNVSSGTIYNILLRNGARLKNKNGTYLHIDVYDLYDIHLLICKPHM